MNNFIDDLKESVIDVMPVCLFILSIGLCLTLLTLTGIEKVNKILCEYEKILKFEYGRTFESYNEFLAYKIENNGEYNENN